MQSKEGKNDRLRKLYPDLSDDQLVEAEDNLRRYLELILGIIERTEIEKGSE
jgi:hypothetical protein